MKRRFIFLKYGLANRLRTIAGFIYIHILTGREIVFHWEINQKDCNGKFYDLFEQIVVGGNKIRIDNKIFNENIQYYFIGQDTINNILRREFPQKSFNCIEIENNIYRYFVPKKYILRRVQSFQYTISIHIRRTDHVAVAKRNNKFTSNTKFIKFIEENKNHNIFLATDDFKTQQMFCRRFKNIVIHKQIARPRDFRQTSLEDAVIDVFIAARAKKFMGSEYSSFSKLIEILRRINNNCNLVS